MSTGPFFSPESRSSSCRLSHARTSSSLRSVRASRPSRDELWVPAVVRPSRSHAARVRRRHHSRMRGHRCPSHPARAATHRPSRAAPWHGATSATSRQNSFALELFSAFHVAFPSSSARKSPGVRGRTSVVGLCNRLTKYRGQLRPKWRHAIRTVKQHSSVAYRLELRERLRGSPQTGSALPCQVVQPPAMPASGRRQAALLAASSQSTALARRPSRLMRISRSFPSRLRRSSRSGSAAGAGNGASPVDSPRSRSSAAKKFAALRELLSGFAVHIRASEHAANREAVL